MIKYTDYYVTFQEIPNEVSLTFTISNCQFHCDGCHSPWLCEDVGKDLSKEIDEILLQYEGMYTCVCFMGEGNDIPSLLKLLPKINTRKALYSGNDKVEQWMYNFDYIKIGRYIKELGGLDCEQSNQKLYENNQGNLLEITKKIKKTIT